MNEVADAIAEMGIPRERVVLADTPVTFELAIGTFQTGRIYGHLRKNDKRYFIIEYEYGTERETGFVVLQIDQFKFIEAVAA